MAQRTRGSKPATTPRQSTFKPRVRRLGDHHYLVESKSLPGVGHQVNTLHGTCSCPAGKRGMPQCWHRTLAATFDMAYMAWMEQGERRARQERVAERPAGMVALQDAFA